jgi:hypothetical protein
MSGSWPHDLWEMCHGVHDGRTKRAFMNSVMNLAVSCRHLLCAWSNFTFQEVAGSMVLVVRKYSRKKEIMTERSSAAVSLCLSYVTSLFQHQLNRQLINWSGSGGGAYSGSGAQVDQLKQLRRFLTESAWSFRDASPKLAILHGSLYT